MSDLMLHDLYQEVILDHNRRPRNFRALEDGHARRRATTRCAATASPSICEVEDGVIADVELSGSGCAISKASASLMTESVKGKTLEEANDAVRAVPSDDHGARPTQPVDDLGKLDRAGRRAPVSRCA